MSNKKNILITGAAGFIGSKLAYKYLVDGHEVYGIDINKDKLLSIYKKFNNFHPIIVDGIKFNEINCDEIPCIDIGYHLAWAGKLGGSDLVDFSLQMSNINMTYNLVSFLLDIGIKKFVFCGSISHYKMIKNKMNVNSDIYGIAKMYAAKLSMELLAQKDIDGNIALLANTFGVGDYSDKAVNTLIRKINNKEPLNLIDGNILNDWVYIEDTLNGLIAIGENGKNYNEYYIGHRKIPTFKENLITLKEVMNSDIELNFGTYNDLTVADYSKVDLDKLYYDTHFECKWSLEQALLETKRWLLDMDKKRSMNMEENLSK